MSYNNIIRNRVRFWITKEPEVPVVVNCLFSHHQPQCVSYVTLLQKIAKRLIRVPDTAQLSTLKLIDMKMI